MAATLHLVDPAQGCTASGHLLRVSSWPVCLRTTDRGENVCPETGEMGVSGLSSVVGVGEDMKASLFLLCLLLSGT